MSVEQALENLVEELAKACQNNEGEFLATSDCGKFQVGNSFASVESGSKVGTVYTFGYEPKTELQKKFFAYMERESTKAKKKKEAERSGYGAPRRSKWS